MGKAKAKAKTKPLQISGSPRRAIPGKYGGGTLRPYPPGESGNPEGRPKAGAVVEEWMDAMAAYSREELQKVARDPEAPAAKSAAAIQWLDIMAGAGDMADFEGLVKGKATLKTLRDQGVQVRLLKRVRPVKDGVAIELEHRGGAALDRVMDRTVGKAKQAIELGGPGGGPLQVQAVPLTAEQIAAAAKLYDQLVQAQEPAGLIEADVEGTG